MNKYIINRLISAIGTLIGVSIVVFLLVRLIPGTVVDQILNADSGATPEMIASLRAFFGLDQPLYVQYAHWIGKAVQGDLGISWRMGTSVLELIQQRLTVTTELTIGAFLVSLLFGLSFGTISAVRENSRLDHAVRVTSLVSLSMPVFWQAVVLILILSVWFKWVPPVGYVSPTEDLSANLRIMILPSIVLGTGGAATIMRMTRSCLLEVLRKDYIRTARSKGLRGFVVITVHAMKNAMVPVVTVLGLQVGALLGGAVVTEEVFSLPGIGRLVLYSIYERDYPVVQGTVLFIALTFVVVNLIVDVLYGYLDPRIRYD